MIAAVVVTKISQKCKTDRKGGRDYKMRDGDVLMFGKPLEARPQAPLHKIAELKTRRLG